MEKQIWKPVKGFELLYQVSSNGVVKNNKGKILSQNLQNSGYLLVHLNSNNKRKAILIHRLVMITFNNETPKEQVDHIDFDKTNNKLSNLKWVSRSENMRKNWDNGKMENTRNAVRENMSKTAHKNKLINSDRLRNLNKLLRKPIVKLDQNGNVLEKFHSAKEAERLGFTNVRKVLSGKQKYCLGFKFIYENQMNN